MAENSLFDEKRFKNLSSCRDWNKFVKWFWKPRNRDVLIKLLNMYACIENNEDRIRLEEDIPCIYGVFLKEIKVGVDVVKRMNEGNKWWKIEEKDGIVKSIKDVGDREWRFVKVGYTQSDTKTGKRIEQLMEECEKRKHCPSKLFKIEIGSVEKRKFREIEDETRRRVGTKVDQRMATQLKLPVPREWVFTTKSHIEEIREKIKDIDENNKEFVKQCSEDKSKIQVKEWHERQDIFKCKSKFAIAPTPPVPLDDLFLKPKLFPCGLCHKEFVNRTKKQKHMLRCPKTVQIPKKRILQANKKGQPDGQGLQDPDCVHEIKASNKDQDSNGGKRRKLQESSPDMKDKDDTQMKQTVLKTKHSLKGKKLLPVIRNLGDVQDVDTYSIKPLARYSSSIRTESMTRDDALKAVEDLTGEKAFELLELAGKDTSDENSARLLLHFCILLANKNGQPDGQDLHDPALGHEIIASNKDQDSNGGKRRKLQESSPDIKDKDYTQVEQVIDKIKNLCTQSRSSEDLILSSVHDLYRLAEKNNHGHMNVYKELYRQCSMIKGKNNVVKFCSKALGEKGAGTVTETKSQCLKETRVSKVKSDKTTSKKKIQPPKQEPVLANLYPPQSQSYMPKYGGKYMCRLDRPQSEERP